MRSRCRIAFGFCIALLALPFVRTADAQTFITPIESAWSAPPGTDPCASEDYLDRVLSADPGLAERRTLFDAMVREAERKGLLTRNRATTAAGRPG